MRKQQRQLLRRRLTFDLGDLDRDVPQAVGAVLVGGAQVAHRPIAGA